MQEEGVQTHLSKLYAHKSCSCELTISGTTRERGRCSPLDDASHNELQGIMPAFSTEPRRGLGHKQGLTETGTPAWKTRVIEIPSTRRKLDWIYEPSFPCASVHRTRPINLGIQKSTKPYTHHGSFGGQSRVLAPWHIARYFQ